MTQNSNIQVAIVDYGMGNIFSVKHACEHVGLKAKVTSSTQDIESAKAIILPGVGAFGDAIKNIEELGLIGVLQDAAASGKPFIGICLGLQLLMEESSEFGKHKGLGIIKGEVISLEDPQLGNQKIKVPQIGWHKIHKASDDLWQKSCLESVKNDAYMYFVHSYCVKPENSETVLTTTQYEGKEFCSSIQKDNVFACQFHPERSGVEGLKVYQNLAGQIGD
jgi:imidazole glycerol-phosphate synthase subunit HisH